ncbi:MAG: hypothetical protein C4539_13410 [Ignavibacteriales bacterium]|nr:MAG: hypothetical protein C4539_13410 [Ignavibacteriales bacterium]
MKEDYQKETIQFINEFNIIVDSQKRRQFFLNPELFLQKEGFTIDNERIRILRNIFGKDRERIRKEIDEKLVLCSSSGF